MTSYFCAAVVYGVFFISFVFPRRLMHHIDYPAGWGWRLTYFVVHGAIWPLSLIGLVLSILTPEDSS